ncbi:MAG: hypothetical protein BMS9Abin02_0538 [Anaerolineae bacterium]|nr:MAG: hypothetical protein BMS9Abin02_0538 [Anaerolineae bacterium]
MTQLRKYGLPLLAFMLLFALVFANVGSAKASARTANWTVAVTYQNVGTQASSVFVEFYSEGSSTPIQFDPLDGGKLAAGAGKSFWIGAVNDVPSGFNGNAVMQSDQPLVATVVQFSQDPGFKMRLLYNGFQTSGASNQYLIPTALLNKFSRTTVFSIQNTENQSIDVTVRFYDADDNGKLVSTIKHTIKKNSSKFIKMDDTSDTGFPASKTVFNGSAIVTAVFTSGGGDANVVAAANEYYTNSNLAASFEGVPVTAAGNTIYLATGLCERFGLDTFYAVSNADAVSGNAKITVEYFNTDGTSKAKDGPYTIGPGQKKSIRTCNPSDGTNMSNFTGSAVVTSTGNAIVVMGKAQNSLNAGTSGTKDVFTAFLGESGGTTKKAMPFVRWANDSQYNDPNNNGGKQRSFIAIENVSNSSGKFDVKYFDKNGKLVATHTLTINASSKGNTNASLAGALGSSGMVSGAFGYYTDNTAGGGVIVESQGSQKFIAIDRVQNPGAGEDANAVPAP